jgi:hypothetical protein
MEEPKLKKNQMAKCWHGFSYQIIEVSNDYDEIAKYDLNKACKKDLLEYGPYDDAIYVAARKIIDNQTYVFMCSRNSETLGD